MQIDSHPTNENEAAIDRQFFFSQQQPFCKQCQTQTDDVRRGSNKQKVTSYRRQLILVCVNFIMTMQCDDDDDNYSDDGEGEGDE